MKTKTTPSRCKGTAAAGAVVALVATLAAAPIASAAYTNFAGTVCKNYNASEASTIDYYTDGVRNLRSSSAYVICPLSRAATSYGAEIWVDVAHFGHRTTRCTAYSYSDGGNLLASATNSATGSGRRVIHLNLRGFGKSNRYSDYSVLCSIPGAASGSLTGIEVDERNQ